MMQNVPRAAVAIANPTNYSVGLEYEQDMAASVCVAKGVDNVALKLRELAAEHDLPIIGNPPLARGLHAGVELEQEILEGHYEAVAEVIGYVMRLTRRTSRAASRC